MKDKYSYVKNAKVIINPDPETLVSIEGDTVRADWYDAYEGICGDYNPDNPDDIHLLRFDIYLNRDGQWEAVDDASYCTRVAYDTPVDTLVEKLYLIYRKYDDVFRSDPEASVKKLGERLSWIEA